MKRNMYKNLFLILVVLGYWSCPAMAALSTYKDSQFSENVVVFPDGGKVYITVSDGGAVGDIKMVVVSNRENPPETVMVEVSDDGMYYDKVANDGVYSGMFIVTTKLTLSPNRDESIDTPSGICYKIVKNIHVDDQSMADIEADLNGDGIKEKESVRLVTLFNVEAKAIKDTSVVIIWNTSDSGYGKVEYGLTSAYNLSVIKEVLIKDLRLFHQLTLTGLNPATIYHYRVVTKDTYGNYHYSEDYSFTTLTTEVLEIRIKEVRSQGDLPKIYYVKTDGDNDDDGETIETAWQNPSVAVSRAEAGDTIYLIEGTWNDEHLEFGHSGIDIAPITLTTYDNGMSVLDGVDKTGFGIRLRGKSYINISGVHIKNYYNAMYFQDGISDINVSNFIVENTQRTGITFTGSPLSRFTFSNFEIYETGIDGGYTALAYGGGSGFSDIEIYDFDIHDTYGSGIYWRYVDRLHINDGRISNIGGGDGVSFSLSTYNSIMENLNLDHLHWHGVAIHDWTVGNNPCFNNTIRDCEVTNASHNHVDLHSGAYNTLVENNTLHEELSFCTGIYFHNRGAGLIARNNHIYNVSRGFSGGGYSEYPLSDVVIQDNIIHDPHSSCFDLSADNMHILGNRLYNDSSGSYTMHAKRSYILMEDNDIEGKTYRIDSGDNNTIRNPRDSSFTIRSAYGSHITFEYTDNTVYKQELTYYSGPYTLSNPILTPEKSYSTMSSTSGENGIVLKITPYPMTVRPVYNQAEVSVGVYDAAVSLGETAIEFNISASSKVDFTLKELNPDSFYNIYRDDILFASRQTDSCREIKFFNYLYLLKKFTIKETDALMNGVISGRVTNMEGFSIVNAMVSDGEKEISVNEDGGYTFFNQPIGEYELTASATGYNNSQKIVILTEQGITVDFILLQDLKEGTVTVYPNPYVKGKSPDERIYFNSLELNSKINIYKISGELITTLENKGATQGIWDISNVASGIYLYLISSPHTKKKGKIAIIK